MKKIIFLYIFLTITSFCDVIRVANFNIKRLGQSQKNEKVVSEIINNFDIVGLEEVITLSGLKSLVKELNKNDKWEYSVSPYPVGTKKYKEYYALLYKPNKVQKVENVGYYPKSNRYIRPPFAFQIQSKNFDFVVILAHSIFGDSIKDRVKEAENYKDVYQYFLNKTREEDIILMGDFNLPATNYAFKGLKSLGIVPIIDANRFRTTLSDRGLASAYDNIFVDLRSLREFNNTYGVYNFAENMNYRLIRKYVSDHIIVFAEFNNDKDLDRR